ncbi:MAG: diguanylate cyclase [Candidatus Sulfobium sp.]|jgi:diguanylate cyclase (GGDEF)-like protein
MNLILRQKIFLGYMAMVFFTLIVGGYAIWSLVELNEISTGIILNDASTQEKITKLNDLLLAQNLYEKRALTFKEPDAEEAFWGRSREFRSLVSEMAGNQPSLKEALQDIGAFHSEYTNLFVKELSLVRKGRTEDADLLSSIQLKNVFTKMLFSVKDLSQKIKDRQNRNINRSYSFGEKALMVTIMLSTGSLLFGIFFASFITRYVTTAIDRLKAATVSIQSGDFDNLPEIAGADELADLAISFKEMSARLKELEEMNLDANPLTKLPGNLAIEKELLTRLNETLSFSFCLADLDNFKAFNDRYGYARGSDVIKWMGELLSTVIKETGNPGDFLGHIGGDDFVIICSPEEVRSICSRIIEEFDRGIAQHYDPEDLKKGYIVSVDRNDRPVIVGIMTLSIAVVNTDRTVIREPKEVAMKVAEIKQYAKTFAKSIYIMDRRRAR